MTKVTKAEKRADKRIERAYLLRCSGVQINIMDIGKVFVAGQTFLAANAAATDQELGDFIAAYVGTILVREANL